MSEKRDDARKNAVMDRGRGRGQFLAQDPDFRPYFVDGTVVADKTTYYPFSNADLSALGTGAETVVMRDLDPDISDMVESRLDQNDVRYTVDHRASHRVEYTVDLGDRPQSVVVYQGDPWGDATNERTPVEIAPRYERLYWRHGFNEHIGGDEKPVDEAYEVATRYLAADGLVIHADVPETR